MLYRSALFPCYLPPAEPDALADPARAISNRIAHKAQLVRSRNDAVELGKAPLVRVTLNQHSALADPHERVVCAGVLIHRTAVGAGLPRAIHEGRELAGRASYSYVAIIVAIDLLGRGRARQAEQEDKGGHGRFHGLI